MSFRISPRLMQGGWIGAGILSAAMLLFAAPASAASPTLALSGPVGAVVGQPISLQAQLAGGSAASGEISFLVFGPGDSGCAGPALAAPTSASVSGDGTYGSGLFQPPGPGTYYGTAHYSGDLENEPADAACTAIATVSKAAPGLTGSASSGVVNSPIRDTATISGGFSPSGSITFRVYGPGDPGCTAALQTYVVAVAADQATSPDFLPQQAGEFHWTASYGGDANNDPVATACGQVGQTSSVAKATPSLTGVASSTVTAGNPITDTVTLAGGFAANGQLVFRAFGPNDKTCATAPKYEAAVAVNGDGTYSPAGFAPSVGSYRWTVAYSGDADNNPAELICDTDRQTSAVGTIPVELGLAAPNAVVGAPIGATATLREGAIPGGQIVFTAFPPGDPTCSGAPAFSSAVAVSGNGSYRSATFAPTRVGAFRWTAAYSGDPNHAAASTGCGATVSAIAQARPTIVAGPSKRVAIGRPFRATIALLGAYAPGGSVTFRIFGPGTAGCAKPLAVNTVTIAGPGNIHSDPFTAKAPGRYRFVASYSGDAANQAAAEPCAATNQMTQAQKRTPRVLPRAVLTQSRQISIRARLVGASSPSGAISFRLFGPGDKKCRAKPAFAGSVAVSANGGRLLAKYLATKSGIYRLAVGYTGDLRNRRDRAGCFEAQQIRVR